MTQKPNPIRLRPQTQEPQVHFERAAFAMVMAAVNDQDETDACRLFPDDNVIPILLRAAVAPGSTTGWAAELAQQATAAFLRSLAPQSAAAALMSYGVEINLDRLGRTTVPARAGLPSILPWVEESQPIPVSKQAITGIPVGPAKKMGLIVVFSGELAKRSSAQGTFSTLLRESAAVSLDAGYFSTEAGDDKTHVGLLYGVTPLAGSGNALDDLTALALAAASGGSGQVVFVTGPGRAASMAVRMPELKTLVLPSLAVPDTRVIAVDPASLVHGAGTEPDMTASRSALLHMSDDPLPVVGSGVTADPVRSLYQTDSIALRCLIDVAFGKRRSGAVAYLDEVTW